MPSPQEFTFYLRPRHFVYTAEPTRSPLREARWKEWLLGKPYVNPFHDLLFALSRSSKRELGHSGETIVFGVRGIHINGEDGRIALEWPKVGKLNFTIPNSDTSLIGILDVLIDIAADEEYHLCSSIERKKLISFFEWLLSEKIRFKEYNSMGRTFLLQNKHYSQIQEIKDRYGIEW